MDSCNAYPVRWRCAVVWPLMLRRETTDIKTVDKRLAADCDSLPWSWRKDKGNAGACTCVAYAKQVRCLRGLTARQLMQPATARHWIIQLLLHFTCRGLPFARHRENGHSCLQSVINGVHYKRCFCYSTLICPHRMHWTREQQDRDSSNVRFSYFPCGPYSKAPRLSHMHCHLHSASYMCDLRWHLLSIA